MSRTRAPDAESLCVLAVRFLTRSRNLMDQALRKQAIRDICAEFGVERVYYIPADKRMQAEDRIFQAIYQAERRRLELAQGKF